MIKKIIIPILLIIIFLFTISAPSDFPTKQIIAVDKTNVQDVGVALKKEKIIRSVFLFKLLARDIKAGHYYFDKKIGLFGVVGRLKEGKSNIPSVRITIPEGSNNEQIAGIIWGKIEKFDAPLFVQKARKYQGYLFPDTYNIAINADEDTVISLLRNTFEKKAGKIPTNIVSMAAILEEEGNNKENRSMISDILWRRLKIGMALQVDVAPDTYKTKGLPKIITNPGLESIQAAENPTPNTYLYYISDEHGIFHYAKTYEEHLVNISKYLKK